MDIIYKIFKYLIAVGILTFGIFCDVYAQRSMGLELGFDYGRIIPHRSYFEPDVTENSFAIDVGFCSGLNPKNYNYHLFSNTSIGGNFVFFKFGDSEIFGQSIGFYPFIETQKKYEKSRLYGRLGLGFSYISEKFNEIENPTNNVISADVNTVVRLEFGYKRKIKDRFWINAGVLATHYSNGNMVQPNLGANLFMGKLGVIYQLRDELATKERDKVVFPELNKKISLRLDFDYGYTTGRLSGRVPGKDLFPITRANLVFAKAASLKGRWLLGLHYELDGSIYETLDYREDPKKFSVASKGMVTVGYEITIGHIGLFTHIGTYFLNKGYEPISFFKHDFLYEIIGINAYLKDPNLNPHNNLFVSWRLKAHAARAQNFSLGVGWVF